jgi:tRNA pseudouridine55 synthase
MSDLIIKINKKCGQTPLECINILKKEDPNLKFLPMTYAGRLDPLAEGVLLILIGDECHQKEKYLNLPKEYEVEVLFGFATDTYDVMGLVTKKTENMEKFFDFSKSDSVSKIQDILPKFIGKIKQSYPPYSSRPVKGKPLFQWAREGRLDEIEIPTHDVNVSNIEIIETGEISGQSLLSKIKEDISKVGGDFRQEEIISLWETELNNKEAEKFKIIKLRIACGSGVYVRGLAHSIGEKLGISTLALNIIRTKVGEYGINL